MDGHAQFAMFQLTILNHRLMMLDDEVQARRRGRAKSLLVHPRLSPDRWLQFRHYDQLIRELRMEDRSLFFHHIKMEALMFEKTLNRVDLESKRLTPTLGKHLHQA